jgi:hypothetical protein
MTLRRTNSDTAESNSQEGNSVREDANSGRDGIKSGRVDKNSNRVDEKSNRESNRENLKSNRVDRESNREGVALSPKQYEVIAYCSIPRTAREILEHIGIGYQTKNVKRYITYLVDSGLLLMSNPEKPNDRNQKYRKA